MIRETISWVLCAVGTALFGSQVVAPTPWQAGFFLGLALATCGFYRLLRIEHGRRQFIRERVPYHLRHVRFYVVDGRPILASSQENAERAAKRRHFAGV